MRREFPIVGIISDAITMRLATSAALSLGIEWRFVDAFNETSEAIDLKMCDVVTFFGSDISSGTVKNIKNLERESIVVRPSFTSLTSMQNIPLSRQEYENEYSVIVARSPHDQVSVWAPTKLIGGVGGKILFISPPPELKPRRVSGIQSMALEVARKVDLIGVATLRIVEVDGVFEIASLQPGPSNPGNWTVSGSLTDQFEQHFRAILDLPLGDPSMRSPFIVSGEFFRRENRDMFRPNLHLIARNPELKIYQYRSVDSGPAGYVSVGGSNLLELIEQVEHALDYLNGDIDE